MIKKRQLQSMSDTIQEISIDLSTTNHFYIKYLQKQLIQRRGLIKDRLGKKYLGNQIQNSNCIKQSMELIQSSTIPSHIESNSHIETPTKKAKKQTADDLNTADSIAFTDQKSSINDIDPHELFDRFHDIIKISQVEEEEDNQENSNSMYRMLDYQNNGKKAVKLNFSPENSSMSKTNKIQTGKCMNNQLKKKQLFEMMPVMSPIKRKIALQNEVQSAEIDSKMEHTPTKMNKSNSHCEMAARKESPYRDLACKI